MKYHQKTFDLLGQPLLFEENSRIERTIKQFERDHNVRIPEALRELYFIKNRKVTLYQFLHIYELSDLYLNCFNDIIEHTKETLYFEEEYKAKRLLHITGRGDKDVFVHCKEAADPVVYLGEDSFYNDNFIWKKSEHPFSEYIYLDIWDSMVAGSQAPKQYKKGERIKMHGHTFTREVYKSFQAQFEELPCTLNLMENRKFYRFQKDNSQFVWVFDDIKTSYYHLYAKDSANGRQLLKFMRKFARIR